MKKVALILHGWPQPIDRNGMYCRYFEKWGYEVITPWLFSNEFKLTSENAEKYIEKSLNGKTPDVIMGISMGGLLAPKIAVKYPNSKMILIATASKLMPKSKGFKLLLALAKNKKLLNALNVVKILPKKFLFGFYESINPFKGDAKDRLEYMEDMKNNFRYILDIPVQKEGEIVEFVSSADNTDLLKTLKNKTLIFSGKNDLLMPEELSEDLHRYLVNSRLTISQGSHFNIISEPSFLEMKKFLAE